MHSGIVVFGAIFVDVKGYPVSQYIPGGRNVGRVAQVHGGVARNVAEDIANAGLRSTLVSVVDDTGLSTDVLDKLRRHHVNTDYIRVVPDGLGTWLAVFDNTGDVAASISKRPDLAQISSVLDAYGNKLFSGADSIVAEIDMESEQIDQIFSLARKYGKEVYAVVSNMSIAMQRRELLRNTGCVVCNEQEAGMLFSEELEEMPPEVLVEVLKEKVQTSRIRNMIVTMGPKGAVYASMDGESGICPPQRIEVLDTTGAGDAFFAGATIGLTYGKTLEQSCILGTRLAASAIATKENTCPRFLPEELGLDIAIRDDLY